MPVFVERLLGLDVSNLSVGQMCARAIFVYFLSLVMMRLAGGTRFAGKYAAIDIVLSITLGATLSRAIVGAAEFFPTLAAGITLVISHWLLAKLAFYFPKVEGWVKGRPIVLIQSGQLKHQALRQASLTSQDLNMILRSNGVWAGADNVERAVLELNGGISTKMRENNAS